MTSKNSSSSLPLVIGIGASAGGLNALKQFFRALPDNSQFAFIIVQHLSPDHKSMMAEILSRETTLKIYQAVNNQKIEANSGYIIPPDSYIEVTDHVINIIELDQHKGSRIAIDHLFRSMASEYQSKAITVLLSGSGSDGTAGLRAVKAAGGLTIAQDPSTAEYPSMPSSAIDAGVVDQICSVEKIPALLSEYAKRCPVQTTMQEAESGRLLRAVSALLKTQENFDLEQYKDNTVRRRISRRMSLTGKEDGKSYISLLREDDDERRCLMRDLLINVSDFFRDKDAFEILESEVITDIVDKCEDHTEVRVWVAGCATGEEAYTLAMLFLDQIQKSQKDLHLKIFATDIDEEAIRFARRGVYPANIIAPLPEHFIKEYFVLNENETFTVKTHLRDKISFATQNVYADPPFSKIHLVSCRNLLIYLRKAVQQKVLKSFYFALGQSSYLFLGSSETIGESKESFKAISTKWRIYQKGPQSNNASYPVITPTFFNKDVRSIQQKRRQSVTDSSVRAKDCLLKRLPPSVIINGDNQIVYLHGNLNEYLNLPEGQAELNFINLLDEDLRTRTRSGLFKSRKSREVVTIYPSRSLAEADATEPSFQIVISPCSDTNLGDESVVVSFEPVVSSGKQLNTRPDTQEQSDQAKMIDSMERELLETREELQNTVEELETSTEELKAAHEEALSTNEELQSSNEELEASTEELRSLNEELTTVNSQLKDKIDLLYSTHNDIKNFFASTNLATIFLSNDLKVKRYTPAAERLLRICAQDIDRPISDVARDLIDEETVIEARNVVESLEPNEKEIETEEGRWFIRKILPYQTEDRHINGVVLTYSEITHLKKVVNNLEQSSRQHTVIAKLGIEALSTDNIHSLMDKVVREVAHTLDADYCKVLQFQPEHNNLLMVSGVGWDSGLVGTATVPNEFASQAGFTLQTNGPVIVVDTQSENRFKPPTLLTNHNVLSGMSCCIENGAQPFGVLGVHSTKVGKFSQDDANFLVSVANLLSVALHRKKMEQQLRENEERLRIAKNSNRMGSFEYIIKTGETYWDEFIREIWGVDKNELLTQDVFYRALHPDDVASVKKAIEAATAINSKGHYHTVYRVINEVTKETYWIEASGQVIFYQGEPLKMIGMVIDVTRQKKMEDSLHLAVEKLSTSNERKNEFLATLGHELRNPLAAVSSGVQIMQHDKSKCNWALNMMSNNVRLLSTLLDDLLDLTRISRGQINLKKMPCNVVHIAKMVAENLSGKLDKKNQILNFEAPQESIHIFADKIRIEQALTNLLNNAHKFTPEFGRISLTVNREGREVVLAVADSGLGIEEKYRDLIFEPFQQIKGDYIPSSAGLGIGLSLVKQFIELHEGTVEVFSNGLGTGSKFMLRLPLPEDEIKPIQRIAPENEEVDLSGMRVMIVDDNEDSAQGLALLLELKLCTVKTFFDATSALVGFDEVKPDVLILDIGLPDMSGNELLGRIKATYSRKTFNIALTGYGHANAREKTKQAGFDVHINKPASIESVLKALKQAKNAGANEPSTQHVD